MYEYKCIVTRVVDGDTLHLSVDLGCDVTIAMVVRLAHVNAPEMRTPEGPKARDFVLDWLAREETSEKTLMFTRPITVRTIKDRKEKYGRYLAVLVAADGTTLNQALLDAGRAVPYEG